MYRVICILASMLVFAPFCYSQDPLPVISSSWRLSTQKGEKVEVPASGPAKALTPDDQNFARNVRALRTDHEQDPGETTPDGRRAELDKIEQQARTPQPNDVHGYSYLAKVRNDGDRTVKIIFWEYRFTEIAHPANVVRRQFLCSVNLKKGSEIDLTAFSALGPTDVINADSLAKSKEKLFDEFVQVNRIEYSDDSVVQRGNWKLADVKAAVQSVTSTPWGKEICRAL
jgi:hypothetical protein